MMIAGTAIGLSIGWVLPAQDKPAGPQWKDRAEYDIVNEEYAKAKDDKGRLAALDKWSKEYPDTQFWDERESFYFGAYGGMKDARKAFDRAKAARTKKPEHYFANVTIMQYLAQLTPRTEADYATATETADYVLANEAKVFGATNKPSNMDEKQWPAVKPAVQTMAKQTKIYALQQQKKNADLETLLTQYIKEDPTQAQFNYTLASTQYAQRQQDQSKWVPAIFNFTRAGVYTGPNALTAANAKIASDSSKSAYKAYHGGMTDYEKVVDAAKNNPLPPAGFTIVSVIDLSKMDAAGKEEWDKAHPELVFWRQAVQIPLTSGGATFASYDGALLPPGPPTSPMTTFTAKIVSMTPDQSPKEMIVEMSDPADPNDVKATLNAKLVFDPVLPGTMPVGSEIKFKGVAKAFQADPFQVTFEIDPDTEGKVEGWTGTGPAPAKQTKQKAGPAKQTKQKAKGK
jgi:hypothetical protein